MPDDLMRLAARCEAATGPDPQIDVDILFAAVWEGQGHEPPQMPYTASLDAAMTLVPEGWGKVCRDDDDRVAFARVYSPDFDSTTFGKGGDWITEITAGQEAKAYGATWSLALCAAALKATAALRAKEPK